MLGQVRYQLLEAGQGDAIVNQLEVPASTDPDSTTQPI